MLISPVSFLLLKMWLLGTLKRCVWAAAVYGSRWELGENRALTVWVTLDSHFAGSWWRKWHSVYLRIQGEASGPHLAGVSARLIAGTEHGFVYLSGVGLLAPLATEHRDVQALEDLGEVICQTARQ